MKRALLALFCATMSMTSFAVTDVYKFSMSMKIPQVVNNTQSLGERKYQAQRFEGWLYVRYKTNGTAEIRIEGLVNKTFKVGGSCVTYKVYVDENAVWNLIGSNRTGKFKKPSVCISIEAQPSYVYSYKPTDDNSLVLTLSGNGSSRKALSGYASGTLGCGCHDYGHVSPTRVMGPYGLPLDIVHDMASAYGTWKARLKYTTGDKE